jgi:hypothetical protein
MGRASRLKRERRGESSAADSQTAKQPQSGEQSGKRLLMTFTNEPFQPVRLYYRMADRAAVEKRLRRLECVVEVPEEGGWQWIYHSESASLGFGGTG